MGRATTFHLQAGQKPGRDAKEEMDMESWGELFTLKLRIVETLSELQLYIYIVVIIYKYIIFIYLYMIVYIKLFKGAFDFFRVFLIGPDVRGFP